MDQMQIHELTITEQHNTSHKALQNVNITHTHKVAIKESTLHSIAGV